MVKRVCERLVVSERRACRVLQQVRSTQRHPRWVADDEVSLTGQITELASTYGRYGYRRITALLRADGWRAWVPESLAPDGPLRPAARRAVGRFLDCGLLEHGFARVPHRQLVLTIPK